eukprot:TRINITY_DN20575_c0_g1_i1.p1 TRINITY_DN20575_c0_g1~~TRINITY_DN20575_c0_g1_i1.p1  ORF type:complete len:241 (+),score=47.23 TRINITY_DN20575_c0_g1_i1:44-766(+)
MRRSERRERDNWDDPPPPRGSDLETELLEQETRLLEQRRDMLLDMIKKVPRSELNDEVRIKRSVPHLLVEDGYNIPEGNGSKTKFVLILDRENNCTQFLNGAIDMPKSLETYVVWNPKSKNNLQLSPSVRDACTIVEAEENVLKAITTIAGMIARLHCADAEEIEVFVVYNKSDSNREYRYKEVEERLSSFGFNVSTMNGTGPNFAAFLDEIGIDWERYSAEGPARQNDLHGNETPQAYY